MLEIVKYNENEYNFPSLLVLGCFDGIHVGHAALLKKAALQAKINGLDLGVMMFSEGKGGRQLYTFEERLKLLEKFKVKFVLKIDFTEEFKATTPMEFLAAVEDKINVKAYMSGKDFRFGAKAAGKSSTLKKYAEDDENGVWYESFKDVMAGEEKVSTTLIKRKLEEGDIEGANMLLGRNFSVAGEVVGGAERGKSLLGFPTINLAYPENKVEIKQGVYKVICTVGENSYVGIGNFGGRPTFDDDTVILEAYLYGFEGDVYGQKVTVEFVKYLRDIVKFSGPEELIAQLNCDLENALND